MLIPTLLVAFLAPRVAAPPAAPGPMDGIVVDELLVVERPGRGGRTPIFTDAVEFALAADLWEPPTEGDEITTPLVETRTWRRIEAGEDGAFSDRALRGGWAWTSVPSAEERVMLLDARGHRHVYVDGEPRGGDLYDLGLTRLPVLLREGETELLFRGGRGRLRAELVEPPAPVFLEERDRTEPDVVRGETEPLWLGQIVTNATLEPTGELAVRASIADGPATVTPLPSLPPLSSRKLAVELAAPERSEAIEGTELVLSLALLVDGEARHESEVVLRLRGPDEKHVRTFVSEVDGSVQY